MACMTPWLAQVMGSRVGYSMAVAAVLLGTLLVNVDDRRTEDRAEDDQDRLTAATDDLAQGEPSQNRGQHENREEEGGREPDHGEQRSREVRVHGSPHGERAARPR